MRQSGSIVKKGGRYYVVYRDLEKKQKWVGGYERKAEAQEERTRILGELQTGCYVKPSKLTFSEYAEQWLEQHVNIGYQTKENYQSYLKKHVNPTIGKAPITNVTPAVIDSLISKLSQKTVCNGSRPLSPATIKKVVSMLATIFKTAVKQRVIRLSPVNEPELPKASKREATPPAKETVRNIFDELSLPVQFRVLFQVEALTGIRRGEILALQWQDINWNTGELAIRRAIKKAKATDGAHKYCYEPGPTKSKRNRTVGLSLAVLNNLKAIFEMASDRSPEAFVFTREGTFINPEYFSKWIAGPLLRKVSKTRTRFHDLRHFFISMLIEQGEDPKYIQDQAGHASITTTFDIYGHLMNKSKPEVASRLEKSVFGPNVRSLLEEMPAEGNQEKVN